jgi:hypothetical protein
MFSDKDFAGKPMTRDYAERRIRWEPLHEVTQIKGDEESHPLLSPEDEFANFETWDVSNIAGNVPKEEGMLKFEYGRSALKLGLELAAKLGVNPYQFGFTGTTDTHTALATSREENYFGKYMATEPGPDRHNTPVSHDFVSQGYGRGVPMGGELSDAPKEKAPRFMVRALRDPDGANLDRVQIIKGWLDKEGKSQERIYDVAASGDSKADRKGRVKEQVGSTVDIDKATYTNEIGAAVLAAHWEDPDFDPAQDAFYYVRVLEIPTPRWTTHDAAFFDIERPDNVPATVQDRAYTSPIWYSAR